MNTNEFIKKIEELGFKCRFVNNIVEAFYDKTLVMEFDVKDDFGASVYEEMYDSLSTEQARRFKNIVMDFMREPVEKRIDNNKFQLRLQHINPAFNVLSITYVINDRETAIKNFTPTVSDGNESSYTTCRFTNEEIELMPRWVHDYIDIGAIIVKPV